MKQVLKLFRELAETGCVDDVNNPELYMSFGEPDIREQLDEFASELGFTLVTVPHRVYLVPDMDNSLLGFSQRELRESIASNARILDVYLQSYIIMVILWMFYGSKNIDPQRMSFLQIKDIIAMLDQRFPAGEAVLLEDWQQKADIDFQQLANYWNSMYLQQEGKRGTRQGAILKACRLLEAQKLVSFYDDQREIRPTVRLNDLMKHYYLSDGRVKDLNRLFEEGAEICRS